MIISPNVISRDTVVWLESAIVDVDKYLELALNKYNDMSSRIPEDISDERGSLLHHVLGVGEGCLAIGRRIIFANDWAQDISNDKIMSTLVSKGVIAEKVAQGIEASISSRHSSAHGFKDINKKRIEAFLRDGHKGVAPYLDAIRKYIHEQNLAIAKMIITAG